MRAALDRPGGYGRLPPTGVESSSTNPAPGRLRLQDSFPSIRNRPLPSVQSLQDKRLRLDEIEPGRTAWQSTKAACIHHCTQVTLSENAGRNWQARTYSPGCTVHYLLS